MFAAKTYLWYACSYAKWFFGIGWSQVAWNNSQNNGGECSSSEQLRKLQLAFENLEHCYET